jgi:chlorite dismutase
VPFEADEPGEFLDLVQELRTTESSSCTAATAVTPA